MSLHPFDLLFRNPSLPSQCLFALYRLSYPSPHPSPNPTRRLPFISLYLVPIYLRRSINKLMECIGRGRGWMGGSLPSTYLIYIFRAQQPECRKFKMSFSTHCHRVRRYPPQSNDKDSFPFQRTSSPSLPTTPTSLCLVLSFLFISLLLFAL